MKRILCTLVYLLSLSSAVTAEGPLVQAQYRDGVTYSSKVFSNWVSNKPYPFIIRAIDADPSIDAVNVLTLFRFDKSIMRFVDGPDCAELISFDEGASVGKVMCAFNRIAANNYKSRNIMFELVDKQNCGNNRTVPLGSFTLSGTNFTGTSQATAIGPSVNVICPQFEIETSISLPNELANGTLEGSASFVLTLNVTNNSSTVQNTVQNTVPIPSGFRFVASKSNSACVQSGNNNVVCTVSSLAANSSTSLGVAFAPNATSACNTTPITINTNTSASSNASINNRTITINRTCNSTSSGPNVVFKLVEGTDVRPGGKLRYRLEVNNPASGQYLDTVVMVSGPAFRSDALAANKRAVDFYFRSEVEKDTSTQDHSCTIPNPSSSLANFQATCYLGDIPPGTSIAREFSFNITSTMSQADLEARICSNHAIQSLRINSLGNYTIYRELPGLTGLVGGSTAFINGNGFINCN